jgi:hypothetical protein
MFTAGIAVFWSGRFRQSYCWWSTTWSRDSGLRCRYFGAQQRSRRRSYDQISTVFVTEDVTAAVAAATAAAISAAVGYGYQRNNQADFSAIVGIRTDKRSSVRFK